MAASGSVMPPLCESGRGNPQMDRVALEGEKAAEFQIQATGAVTQERSGGGAKSFHCRQSLERESCQVQVQGQRKSPDSAAQLPGGRETEAVPRNRGWVSSASLCEGHRVTQPSRAQVLTPAMFTLTFQGSTDSPEICHLFLGRTRGPSGEPILQWGLWPR